MSSPKFSSEPDLPGGSNEKTPVSQVTQRKRKRLQPTWSVEMSELREEMKELFSASTAKYESQMNKLSPILNGIQQSNTNIEASINFLAEENCELKLRIKERNEELKNKNEQVVLLEARLEETQRINFSKMIEIKNVPLDDKVTQESMIGMISTLSSNLGMEVSESDIGDIFSIKSSKSDKKSIIVEFKSTMTKNKILKSAKSHNLQNKSSPLNAGHLGLNRNQTTPIYIAERLTPRASRLCFLARDLKKSKGYIHCWTSYGRVYVRKSDESPVIWITNELQVQMLFNE